MKALTIWQPWASLILIGAKPYEFRGWKPPRALIGQRMAIHAGTRKIKRDEVLGIIGALQGLPGTVSPCLHAEPAFEFLLKVANGYALPHGAVIGSAIVGEPKRGDAIAAEFGAQYGNDSDRMDTFNWGWPMLDVQPLLPPAEVPGKQGLWDFNEWPHIMRGSAQSHAEKSV